MKLMIFYEDTGSEELFYKCLDIAKEDDTAKVVDDFVRSLCNWKNSIRIYIRKAPHMPDPSFVACYKQGEEDIKDESIREEMKVEFHIRDDKKTMNSRKALCSFVDTTLKDKPRSGRQLLKKTAESPQTRDFEVEYLMEFLLKGVRYRKKKFH